MRRATAPRLRIKHPAQVLPVARFRAEDRVDLVEEQRRLQFCDRSEQRGVGDVRRRQWLSDEQLEHFEEPRLPRPFFGRWDRKVRRCIRGGERMGVEHPERDRGRLLAGEDDEATNVSLRAIESLGEVRHAASPSRSC
jgi:hypothetical protein